MKHVVLHGTTHLELCEPAGCHRRVAPRDSPSPSKSHAKVGEIAARGHCGLVSPDKHPQTQDKRIPIA